MILSFLVSLVLFIPAFIANPAAVVTGGHVILDGNRTWRGKRILGDHKTLSGLLGGTAAGVIIGLILNYIFLFAHLSYLTFSSSFPTAFSIVLSLSFFSMFGDLVGSFIKRRLGRKPGQESIFLDQYPFALSALFFTYVLFPGISSKLFPWEGIIAILVVTPLIHRAVNIIGYRLKMKDVPY